MNDVLGFNYLQAPSRDSLKRSLQQLLMLGALDRKTVGDVFLILFFPLPSFIAIIYSYIHH